MDNRQYNEKSEKDEKERGKHDEKTAEEKWRRDPLGTLVWAASASSTRYSRSTSRTACADVR